jgi:ribosome-associated toxin RatA of RatAB toxin-antitoxin module
MNRTTFVFLAAVSMPILLGAAESRADTWVPPTTDAQACELVKLGGHRRATFAVPGAKVRAGRAEIVVDAPLSTVRAAVLDYARYPTIIPRFEKAKVLKRTGLAADVFLQLPIMKGSAAIWTVQRFSAPVASAGGEAIKSTSLQGNVEDLRTTWSYRAIDARHTLLVAEIYVVPKLPAPGALIEKEAEKAASEAVVSIKAHAERAPSTSKG